MSDLLDLEASRLLVSLVSLALSWLSPTLPFLSPATLASSQSSLSSRSLRTGPRLWLSSRSLILLSTCSPLSSSTSLSGLMFLHLHFPPLVLLLCERSSGVLPSPPLSLLVSFTAMSLQPTSSSESSATPSTWSAEQSYLPWSGSV